MYSYTEPVNTEFMIFRFLQLAGCDRVVHCFQSVVYITEYNRRNTTKQFFLNAHIFIKNPVEQTCAITDEEIEFQMTFLKLCFYIVKISRSTLQNRIFDIMNRYKVN